jgi:hypothetical protein
MKYIIPFLVAMSLLAACETTYVYPTKVVEVQTVKTETPAPVVVTQTVTKIDCASIDFSFQQVGDTCVSTCVECIKNGGQCLDTDINGYGDTCVTPVACTPQEEFCNNVDDDCDGETDENQKFWYVDSDHDGFGDPNKPVVAGCVPSTTGPWLVINDEDCNDNDAKISPTTADLCDGKDNNCNGYADESFGMLGANCQMGIGECAVADSINVCTADGSATTCSKPAGTPKTEVCGDNKDNDCDGETDDVDVCDCSDVKKPSTTGNGYADWCNKCTGECKTLPDISVTKDSYKLVLVWGGAANAPYTAGAYVKTAKSVDELKFSSKTFFDESWEEKKFPQQHFVAVNLDKDASYVAMNVIGYPGYWYLCAGNMVNEISVALAKDLPKVYLVSGGVWQEVGNKLEVLKANDLEMVEGPIYGGDYNKGKPAYCAALLNLK